MNFDILKKMKTLAFMGKASRLSKEEVFDSLIIHVKETDRLAIEAIVNNEYNK